MATLAGIYWIFTLPCVILIPIIIIACVVANHTSDRNDAKHRAAFNAEHEHDFDYLDDLFSVK